VVKCIPLPNPKSKKAAQKEQAKVADTLYQEYMYYTNGLLYGFGLIPKIPRGAYGQDAGHRYMVNNLSYSLMFFNIGLHLIYFISVLCYAMLCVQVMEALDYDLMALTSDRKPRPSNAAIADIGLQILAGLRFLHNKVYPAVPY
jgi:hypothetical protein